MKKLLILTPVLLALTLATRTFAAEAEEPAPDAITNAATTNVPDSGGITITKGNKEIVIHPNPRFPLPPEVMSKLTGQELIELEKTRYSRSQMQDVMVPLGFFAGVVVIVGLVTAYRMKRARMLQETVRLMVEKGTPIPPELLLPPEPRKRPRNDLRTGLIWCGIGVALLIYLSGLGHRLWALGLIPLLVGAAFLVAWKVEQKKVQ